MIKISVIIPVYNMEQHVEECLDSVLEQSLKEIEVICVDDGSTDRTSLILEKYKLKNKNLKVFHQENQGSGIARNRGIKESLGEYIAFMDSDDKYPDCETLQDLYNAAIVHDVEICGGMYKMINTPSEYGWATPKEYFQNQIVKYEDFQMWGGYICYIYKRTLICNNNILFPNYLRGQDSPFFVKAMITAKVFYAMDRVVFIQRPMLSEEKYTLNKMKDLAKGLRDVLMLADQYKLEKLAYEMIRAIQTKFAAPIERLLEVDDKECQKVIDDINLIMKKMLEEPKVSLITLENRLIRLQHIEKIKNTLMEFTRTGKPIYIYGAGAYGNLLYNEVVQKHGITIKGFIVSKINENSSEYKRIPIIVINSESIETSESLVIVALSEKFKKEVLHSLREYNYKNVIWCTGNDIWAMILNKE